MTDDKLADLEKRWAKFRDGSGESIDGITESLLQDMVIESLTCRVRELEAALRLFKNAWDTAESGFDGMTAKSADAMEAASELAAEVLSKGA